MAEVGREDLAVGHEHDAGPAAAARQGVDEAVHTVADSFHGLDAPALHGPQLRLDRGRGEAERPRDPLGRLARPRGG